MVPDYATSVTFLVEGAVLSCTVDRIQPKPGCIAHRPLLATTLLTCILISNSSARARQSAPQSDSAGGQTSERSLADIAREAKKGKAARASKAITEDDLAVKHGPLPRLNVEGDDNWDEVVTAVGEFQAKHTPPETEHAVRDWFDEYDNLLAAAIKDNLRTNERRTDSTYNNYLGCQSGTSYEECASRQRAEMRGAHDDQVTMHHNGMVIGRIQQSFMKIRTGIAKYHLQYSWFKIRNANGNGSF